MSVGKDMNFMRKSKIMDFECRLGGLRGRRRSILQPGECTQQPGEVRVDI